MEALSPATACPKIWTYSLLIDFNDKMVYEIRITRSILLKNSRRLIWVSELIKKIKVKTYGHVYYVNTSIPDNVCNARLKARLFRAY